jgi:hypothetical protein
MEIVGRIASFIRKELADREMEHIAGKLETR